MVFLLKEIGIWDYWMNEEYLVEPTGFKNAFELKYLLEKFGFYQGRFIGQLPKKWPKAVYEQMSSLPDIEQSRIRRLMEQNKNSLVPSGQEFNTSMTWLENAHHQIEQEKFAGAIAAEANQWSYPTVEEVDEDYLKGGRSIRILASSVNYTKYTRRLLQLSPEIVLVDPYLKLYKEGCERVLTDFLTVAQQGKCRSMVIWARFEESSLKTKQAYQQMLDDKYRSKLQKGSTLTVKLVDDHASIEKMHTRLMLSSLGCFRFDKGFSEFDEEIYVDVDIIDRNAHNHHYLWYCHPSSDCDFKSIEEHTVAN